MSKNKKHCHKNLSIYLSINRIVLLFCRGQIVGQKAKIMSTTQNVHSVWILQQVHVQALNNT